MDCQNKNQETRFLRETGSLLQHHLQFDFIADWDAVHAGERDFRFQAAVFFDRVDVDGGDDEAALLVEAQGRQVIIRGHQPQPPALLSTRSLPDRFDERGAYAQASAPCVQRDDLAGFAFKLIGEQTGDFALSLGDETRQLGRMIDCLVDNDGLRPPCFDDFSANPVAVSGGKKTDFQIRYFLGFSS